MVGLQLLMVSSAFALAGHYDADLMDLIAEQVGPKLFTNLIIVFPIMLPLIFMKNRPSNTWAALRTAAFSSTSWEPLWTCSTSTGVHIVLRI